MRKGKRNTARQICGPGGLRLLTNSELKFVYEAFMDCGYKAARVLLWTNPRNCCVSSFNAVYQE
jgi:hypothetical protein